MATKKTMRLNDQSKSTFKNCSLTNVSLSWFLRHFKFQAIKIILCFYLKPFILCFGPWKMISETQNLCFCWNQYIENKNQKNSLCILITKACEFRIKFRLDFNCIKQTCSSAMWMHIINLCSVLFCSLLLFYNILFIFIKLARVLQFYGLVWFLSLFWSKLRCIALSLWVIFFSFLQLFSNF